MLAFLIIRSFFFWLTIFAKSSIVDVRLGSKYASENIPQLLILWAYRKQISGNKYQEMFFVVF